MSNVCLWFSLPSLESLVFERPSLCMDWFLRRPSFSAWIPSLVRRLCPRLRVWRELVHNYKWRKISQLILKKNTHYTSCFHHQSEYALNWINCQTLCKLQKIPLLNKYLHFLFNLLPVLPITCSTATTTKKNVTKLIELTFSQSTTSIQIRIWQN